MSDQNQGGMISVDGETIGLSEFANVSFEGVKPVYGLERLPAGSFKFEITDFSLGTGDREKPGSAGARVVVPTAYAECTVREVHSVSDKTVDANELIDKKHRHNFNFFLDNEKGILTQKTLAEGLGRILAFAQMVRGEEYTTPPSLQEIQQEMKGKTFDGFIIHARNTKNPDQPFANLDVAKDKIKPA